MPPHDFLPEETRKIVLAKHQLSERLNDFNLTLGKLGLKYQHSYFVSGGCFASYLQDETPKDIDIYFIDEQLANRVVELYTKDSSYTNEVEVISEKYRDVKGHPQGLCITENAVTLKNGLQLITKHYGDPRDVRDTFDFVHCMPYYDSRDSLLYISREQYNCCVNKCLIINNSSNFTAWREQKFLTRGYGYGSSTK